MPKIIQYTRSKLDLGTVNPVLITVAILQLIKNIFSLFLAFDLINSSYLWATRISDPQYEPRLFMLRTLCPQRTVPVQRLRTGPGPNGLPLWDKLDPLALRSRLAGTWPFTVALSVRRGPLRCALE